MKRARCVTEIDLHIARRLKAARLSAKISQAMAGETLDVTFQQIQKYEKGSNRISAGKLVILATLYKTPVAWFFEGIPDVGTDAPVSDPVTEMMSVPYGADLARDFIAITHNHDRHVVAEVARSLAKRARETVNGVRS